MVPLLKAALEAEIVLGVHQLPGLLFTFRNTFFLASDYDFEMEAKKRKRGGR